MLINIRKKNKNELRERQVSERTARVIVVSFVKPTTSLSMHLMQGIRIIRVMNSRIDH